MTISGSTFLDLQSQMSKIKEKTASNELSGGTATPPKPIQIKSSEAQTVSDALKKAQINPAILQNTTPKATITAAKAPSKEEEKEIANDILLNKKKKTAEETR